MSAASRALPGSAPTLDQLRVLVAVVDTGSFSAAARALNRTQSVVSYTIAAIEGTLGLSLFDRTGRRPALTQAGTALLADARRVVRTTDELRARAAGMTRGLEAEVALAVDVMFPTELLVAAIEGFAREYPTVALRLQVEALGMVTQLVLDGSCAVGISGPSSLRLDALERRAIGPVLLIPVAAPAHPLATLPDAIRADALHEHTQLVLSDRSTLTAGQDFGVLSPRTWRLGDLGAKHALLCAGLGWGYMPLHIVADDVAAGRLVRLRPCDASQTQFPLMLIHRADAPPGPAGTWLASRLAVGRASDAVASVPTRA